MRGEIPKLDSLNSSPQSTLLSTVYTVLVTGVSILTFIFSKMKQIPSLDSNYTR